MYSPLSRKQIRELVLSRPIPERLIENLARAPRRRLTPALEEALELAALGRTDGEIALELGISLPAAKDRVLRLLALYEVRNRTELAALVARGAISPD